MTRSVKFYSKNIIFLKVLGFRSISIVDGKSVTKPTDVLYLIASISLGVLICYLSLIYKDAFATSKSDIANYGNFITHIASIVVSISTMISVFIFRHRLWSVMMKLSLIEDKVNRYLIRVNCNQ